MASILASLQRSSTLVQKPNTLFTNLTHFAVNAFSPKVGQNRISLVVKATGETESSTSLSIAKSVQNIWDKSEDRIAVIELGLAAVVGILASANLIGINDEASFLSSNSDLEGLYSKSSMSAISQTIDKLPVIPSTLEFIGILFSAWFTYRYLLFKPDREELFRIIKKSIFDVLGQ